MTLKLAEAQTLAMHLQLTKDMCNGLSFGKLGMFTLRMEYSANNVFMGPSHGDKFTSNVQKAKEAVVSTVMVSVAA